MTAAVNFKIHTDSVSRWLFKVWHWCSWGRLILFKSVELWVVVVVVVVVSCINKYRAGVTTQQTGSQGLCGGEQLWALSWDFIFFHRSPWKDPDLLLACSVSLCCLLCSAVFSCSFLLSLSIRAFLKLLMNCWKALKHSSIRNDFGSSQKNSASSPWSFDKSSMAFLRHSSSLLAYWKTWEHFTNKISRNIVIW